jgi:DNA uptake protein ComE-like DNA-binding protein
MDRLNEILSTYRYPMLLGLVGFVLIFSGSFSTMFHSQTENKPIPKESVVSNEQSGEVIKVDINGAVEKPGIFTLSKNARVDDLLKMAGGLKNDANAEFVAKQLNLSQKLNDGQKIYSSSR